MPRHLGQSQRVIIGSELHWNCGFCVPFRFFAPSECWVYTKRR